MKYIGAFEAKTPLSRILQQVNAGESFAITKHGTPVPLLCPPESSGKRPVREIIDEIYAFQARHSIGDATLTQLIEEGRP